MDTKDSTNESVKDVFSQYKVDQTCGYFSFDRDYISRFQLIKACEKLVKDDPKVLRCVVRNSGTKDNVEFVYEDSGKDVNHSVIHKFKEHFSKELGIDDSMDWRWSVTVYSYVIKA